MDKKTLLAIVLSMAVIFLYQTYFAPPPPKRQAPPAEGQVAAPKETPAVQMPAATGVPGAVLATGTGPAEQEIKVNTPLYEAIFTTRGGALKSFRLKNYNKDLDKKSGLVELVDIRDSMPLPLNVTFPDSTLSFPQEVLFETDSTRDIVISADNRQPRQLIFRQTFPGKAMLEKIYTFEPNKYLFDLELRIHNLSAQPLTQNPSLDWTQYFDPKIERDSYSHEGPVSFITENITRHGVDTLAQPGIHGPNVAWGAFESKYFIAAMIPNNPVLTSLHLAKDQRDMVSTSLRGPKIVVPAAQIGVANYTLFLGPKDFDILKEKGVGLEYAIDFSDWLRWLVVPLLMLLKFFYSYVGNYGIAIIILTILIKIIFWPLGNKSYRSMKEMQKLQPKIMELRDRYKDDKSKLSQETMNLYRTHKVNPLGGCLPMLIQIPVFFGLYKALLYAIELRHAPLFGWIQDLSAQDPYYITPIIMGATMFIQQKMAPPMGDPLQNKIMLLMPVVFTVLFLTFPSGLVLYWLFNNVISIAQQLYINKKYA